VIGWINRGQRASDLWCYRCHGNGVRQAGRVPRWGRDFGYENRWRMSLRLHCLRGRGWPCKDHHLSFHWLPAPLRVGVSDRRPCRWRNIQNRFRSADHLRKDGRKRGKAGARILPSMRIIDLLHCRRRRAEVLLHPCGNHTPTRGPCPQAAELVSLTAALGHRSRLRS